MSRKIVVDALDTASIDAAPREIREYEKWLDGKCEELRVRIAELIRESAEAGFRAVADTEILKGGTEMMTMGDVSVEVEYQENLTVVVANGSDAVWIEFGAGVYYNTPAGTSPNPLAADAQALTGMPFTIGSYGHGLGAKMVWGYRGADGEKHVSRGTPASMPFYHAITAIVNDIGAIAREVFST